MRSYLSGLRINITLIFMSSSSYLVHAISRRRINAKISLFVMFIIYLFSFFGFHFLFLLFLFLTAWQFAIRHPHPQPATRHPSPATRRPPPVTRHPRKSPAERVNASFHSSNRPWIPCDAYTKQLHMTQSSCKHYTKSKSHPGMRLAPVQVFSGKHTPKS